MENNTKTDNFLKAIKKHAQEQRNAMREEVEHLKEEKINEAKVRGKLDSEKYIAQKLSVKKSEETRKIAKALQDGQKELFLKRNKMTESVFVKAQKKLIDFAKTDDYIIKLLDSAEAIAKIFDNCDCVLYINERDLSKSDRICSLFKGKAEIKADKSIKIGGIKGYCEQMRIVADETLDSKLAHQRQWFIKNSGLSVL